MTNFIHTVQTCLLIEGASPDPHAQIKPYLEWATSQGHSYNIVEHNPGSFIRLFGTDKLMITVEVMQGKANAAVFQPSLKSGFTQSTVPDALERINRHTSHILINVSHGVLPNVPGLQNMLGDLGLQEGQSLKEYIQRLRAMDRISQIFAENSATTLIHYTPSAQLIRPEMLAATANAAHISPLWFHPQLFSDRKGPDGTPLVQIKTFGAKPFVGREIKVSESPVPWPVSFQNICMFLSMATMEGGYVIPDGNIFRPEDESFAYRVHHRAAQQNAEPFYELEPMLHRATGFKAADYIEKGVQMNIDAPQSFVMDRIPESGQDIVRAWREQRAKAQAIGGDFQVRAQMSALPPRKKTWLEHLFRIGK